MFALRVWVPRITPQTMKLPHEINRMIMEYHSYKNLEVIIRNRDYKHLLLISMFTRLPNITIHWATQQQDLQLVRILLKSGLDINYQDELGITPLYIAIVQRNYEMVLVLLQSGASTSLKTLSGTSIAQIARVQGRLWTLEI